MAAIDTHVGDAGPAIRDGRVPRRGRLVLCDACRWPFVAPRADGGNCRPVCGDCRRAEFERVWGLMARLAALRTYLFPDHRYRQGVAPPPGHEGRIRLYESRAERGLPLFRDDQPEE